MTGAGTYGVGTSVRITSVADESHTLISWKAGNTEVSYTDFDIVVSDNVDYVAYFNSISNVVPIGQAVASNAIFPTDSYFNYSLTEQIYTVQELGEAHDISSVAFFNAGTTKTRNCRIFMKHTDKSVFQSASDWVAATPDDLLFEGEIKFTKGEWKTIYFNRAFVYDGIHNVVLIIDDNTGTYSKGLSCRVFEDAPHMSIYVVGDYTNFDPYNPFDNNGNYWTDDTQRNQVLFGIASYDYNVTVSADPNDGGMVSAQEGPFYYGQPVTVTAIPTGNNVFYYWSENGERVSSDATYNFTITASRNLVAHFNHTEGIDEQSGAQVLIYPNPVSNKLTVEAKEAIGTVEIYNLMGTLVLSQKGCGNKVEIHTNDLPSGIYFIRLTNTKVSETRRFVKE